MIRPPEQVRIKIGLVLVLILSIVMLADNIQNTLTIKRLEQANRLLLSHHLRVVPVKHPVVKHS